jgi:hypothetical protein
MSTSAPMRAPLLLRRFSSGGCRELARLPGHEVGPDQRKGNRTRSGAARRQAPPVVAPASFGER